MKHVNTAHKSYLGVISLIVGGLLSGCSSMPNKTLDGKPLRPIPQHITIPSGSVVIAAVCVVDKKAQISENIRFGKIFKKGFSTKRMKHGYPEKMNDHYWYVQDLGEIGKINAFVLPDGYEEKQKLSFIWNLRDRRISYEWTPWLNPDLRIQDISNYNKEEWGLVGRESFKPDEDKTPFLVKFKRINYHDLILEQINHWNIYPVEGCSVGDVSKDIWVKNRKFVIEKEDSDEKDNDEQLLEKLKSQRVIKEIEVSVDKDLDKENE